MIKKKKNQKKKKILLFLFFFSFWSSSSHIEELYILWESNKENLLKKTNFSFFLHTHNEHITKRCTNMPRAHT
jgi:hypothetical protein